MNSLSKLSHGVKYIILIFFSPCYFSQNQPINTACFCEKIQTITLYDSLVLHVKSQQCVLKNDLSLANNNISSSKKHNLAWFILDIKKCGNLTFTISTTQKEGDFKFLVFKDTINYCDLISKNKVQPIRSNWSNFKIDNIKTGLDLHSTKLYSDKSSKSSFNKRLPIQQNEKVILFIESTFKDQDFDLSLKINEIEFFNIYCHENNSKANLNGVNFDFLTKNNEQLFAILNSDVGYMNLKFAKKHSRLPLPDSKRFKYDINDFNNIRISKKGYFSAVITGMERPCKEIYHVKLDKLVKGNFYFYKGIYIDKNLNIDFYLSQYYIKALKLTIENNRSFNYTITDLISEHNLTEGQKLSICEQLVKILDCGHNLKVKILTSNSRSGSGIILKVE